VKNTIQISYWTIGGFEGAKRPEVALEEAKAMGYEGVELAFGAGELVPEVTETRCREIASAAESMGMKIDSVASGNYWQQSLTHPDAAVREEAVAFAMWHLRVADWLGAGVVLVLPGAVAVPWDDSQPVVPYADAWHRATEAMEKLAITAEEIEVTVALENVWGWFLADPVAMKSFVDQFKSPRVGVYLDVANCLINGYPEHWIEMLGGRVKAVHFKNFSRSDCGGGLHGFGDDLLKGDVDWPAVVAALEKINYSGPITAEMIPFSRLPDMVLPDMDLARDTAPKMRKILGRE